MANYSNPIEKWYEYCAHIVKPCAHTINEVIEYMQNKYTVFELADSSAKISELFEDDLEGSDICGYEFPYEGKNIKLFHDAYEGSKYHEMQISLESITEKSKCYVFIDKSKLDFIYKGFAGRYIVEDLGMFLGITSDDIAQKNKSFVAYISRLAARGEIKSLQEFV